MKVVITSGSTTEQIDKFRCITNGATGMLGSLIAKEFSTLEDIDKIYYVCGEKSILPESPKTEIITINNVASLETVIKEILCKEKIDIIVHSMAVSDYRLKSISSIEIFANTIASHQDLLENRNKESLKESVKTLLTIPETSITNDGKISSNIEDMLLLMEQTPKIISLFQTLSPNSILVGFKLLNNVPLEELIDTGFNILKKNKCSFVLANDSKYINNENHIGYLIDKSKNYNCYKTKKEIAIAIVLAAIEKRRNSK